MLFVYPLSYNLPYNKVSANTVSSRSRYYKKSDGSHDARRESPEIPNGPSDTANDDFIQGQMCNSSLPIYTTGRQFSINTGTTMRQLWENFWTTYSDYLLTVGRSYLCPVGSIYSHFSRSENRFWSKSAIKQRQSYTSPVKPTHWPLAPEDQDRKSKE